MYVACFILNYTQRFTAIKLGLYPTSTLHPKPNLVETTKACVPDFAPYFMAGVVGSFFIQRTSQP
jgi:hypothetical protein